MNFCGDKNKSAIGDLLVSTTPNHRGPSVPSAHQLLLLHLGSLRPSLSSLCLFWSALSPGKHWNKYLVSLEGAGTQAGLAASPHILDYVHHVLSIQPITLQDPHRKGREGWMAAPSGRQRLTGVDTITMSISSCASGDTIHIHSLGACCPTCLSGLTHFDGFPKGL